MKIRNGFVSNSSSSSFCIFGIKENLCKIGTEDDFPDEYLEKILQGSKYTKYVIDGESGVAFLGISPGRISEDITLAEYRKLIAAELKEKGFSVSEADIKWYEGEIYN